MIDRLFSLSHIHSCGIYMHRLNFQAGDGNKYVFAVVDIASWQFSDENHTTKVSERNILLPSYADFGMDG